VAGCHCRRSLEERSARQAQNNLAVSITCRPPTDTLLPELTVAEFRELAEEIRLMQKRLKDAGYRIPMETDGSVEEVLKAWIGKLIDKP
jgi:CRP-like cAMP-binding protein